MPPTTCADCRLHHYVRDALALVRGRLASDGRVWPVLRQRLHQRPRPAPRLHRPVAGTLTAAHVDCRVYSGAGQFNAAITGTFNAKPLTFNVQIHSNYKGAGTYSVGSLLDGAGELRLQVGDFVASTASGAGTLTIDKGGASRAMDAEPSSGEHAKGTFRCDEVHTA